MTITCYSNFSKKNNSTKQPTGSGTDFTCTLKEPTSIINPVFIFETSNDTYNYIKWGSRYYFVNDVIMTHNNYTEYHCTIDPMATWKTNIGAMSEYVLRSASAHDGNIIDTMYPSKTDPTVSITLLDTLSDGYIPALGNGFYVVGVIGTAGASSNAIQYYAISAATFRSLLAYLFDSNAGTTWLDTSERDMSIETQKQFMNPMQYIASCHWYPCALPDASYGSTEYIQFGWWTSPVQALLLNRRKYVFTQTVTLPAHPDAASRGNYLNSGPYSERTLYAWNFGAIPLPCQELISNLSLYIALSVDLWSGSGFLSVSCGGHIVSQISADAGCDVPIAQISGGLLGTLSRQVSVDSSYVASILPVKSFEHAVLGVYSSIADAIAMKSAKVGVVGGQGSDAVYNQAAFVNNIFYRPVNEDNTQLGRPLCQVKTINTLSGYILCSNVEVDIPATEPERETIAGYMTSGFFYE